MISTEETTIEDTFTSLKKGAQKLRLQPIHSRKALLRHMERWILFHREEIRAALFQDLQKEAYEADVSEIFPVLSELRHIRRNLRSWARPQRVAGSLAFLGTRGYIHYEPKGACLIISPWNYPFLLAVGPVLSAVAAGNTFVLKPSEFTPATNAVIGKLLRDMFSPDTGCLVEGEAETAKRLLQFPFDHIFFTGSPSVGKMVMGAAAKNLTSVTLELGGKSPTIIDESADLKDAARKVAWGKWLNAGQTCLAPDYLFIHESKKDAFLPLLRQEADRLYGGEQPYTGIINERHYDRLNQAIQEALDGNAAIAFGGNADRAKCRIHPIVLTGVSHEASLMQEEIFGPVLPVMTYTDLHQVIAYINDRPKPLAIYLFSRRKATQNRLIHETSAGTMVINDCVLQFGHPNLPFGGVNHSGIGKAHGHAGFIAFSNEKAVLRQRIGLTAAQSVYPPYSTVKKKVIDFMLRFF